VTTLMNWAVRNGAETESIMNSVERVMYTTTQTPQVRSHHTTLYQHVISHFHTTSRGTTPTYHTNIPISCHTTLY
jgi:hypothetical protein